MTTGPKPSDLFRMAAIGAKDYLTCLDSGDAQKAEKALARLRQLIAVLPPPRPLRFSQRAVGALARLIVRVHLDQGGRIA